MPSRQRMPKLFSNAPTPLSGHSSHSVARTPPEKVKKTTEPLNRNRKRLTRWGGVLRRCATKRLISLLQLGVFVFRPVNFDRPESYARFSRGISHSLDGERLAPAPGPALTSFLGARFFFFHYELAIGSSSGREQGVGIVCSPAGLMTCQPEADGKVRRKKPADLGQRCSRTESHEANHWCYNSSAPLQCSRTPTHHRSA